MGYIFLLFVCLYEYGMRLSYVNQCVNQPKKNYVQETEKYSNYIT